MDPEEAISIATARVVNDRVDEHLDGHRFEVAEEADGWWVRWAPPADCLGGGPNVFICKSDGRVVQVYYTR